MNPHRNTNPQVKDSAGQGVANWVTVKGQLVLKVMNTPKVRIRA